MQNVSKLVAQEKGDRAASAQHNVAPGGREDDDDRRLVAAGGIRNPRPRRSVAFGFRKLTRALTRTCSNLRVGRGDQVGAGEEKITALASACPAGDS